MPAILPIMPLFLPIIFMTSAICMCILSRRLMSAGVVPEPLATRRLRLPSSSFGLRRSLGVIEPMMARICLKFLLAATSSIWPLILPMPGIMPISPPMPPRRSICASCSAMSSRSKAPFFIRAAILAAFSTSMVCEAFSTRPTMSPMPRMRPAMREGSNSSSASHFSPTPSSLIGLPVTARMDSAAPPRPSPSARVSTLPVMPMRASKALAVLTASWPVSASTTSSTSCGCTASRTAAASAISSSSTVVRPAVSKMTTS